MLPPTTIHSFSSPVRQKSKDLPQRPPPPKLMPRKNISLAESADVSTLKTLAAEMSVDSTTKTSVDEKNSAQKPKPPIRTRKKKFCSAEETRQLPRQSEFVELSTSDIVIDASGGIHIAGSTEQGVDAINTLVEDKVQEGEEEKEANSEVVGDDSESDKRTANEIELDKDEWEVIPDDATNEGSSKGVLDEPCLQPNG